MKRLRHNTRVLGVLVLTLFIALGAYFAYSVFFYGGRWFASAYNPRLLSAKQHVIAGDIRDQKGTLLATTDKDGNRTYPKYTDLRRAVSHVVGDAGGYVANGVETFMARYLLGFESGIMDRINAFFTGSPARGDDLVLTIDADLSEHIQGLLMRYQAGACVVYNYKTGEIVASVSYPDFDPRNVKATLNAKQDNGALVNRVTQGLYPPGSTFKIITMASALENMPDALTRSFDCTGQLPVERTIVTEAQSSVHSTESLQKAFADSCNTTFATLALELGYTRLSQTAANFGFSDNFLFRDMVVYNSQFPVHNQSRDDLAWAGIGQGRVLVTPLHMAMIAGAIANDGVMMEPRLLSSATSPQGQARALVGSRVYRRSVSVAVSKELQAAMLRCVSNGSGRSAAVNGLTVAGKTGSAEASDNKNLKTHAWFVGYIAGDDHPLAIAVVVEYAGSGGSIAAPIASSILSKAVKLGY